KFARVNRKLIDVAIRSLSQLDRRARLVVEHLLADETRELGVERELFDPAEHVIRYEDLVLVVFPERRPGIDEGGRDRRPRRRRRMGIGINRVDECAALARSFLERPTVIGAGFDDVELFPRRTAHISHEKLAVRREREPERIAQTVGPYLRYGARC